MRETGPKNPGGRPEDKKVKYPGGRPEQPTRKKLPGGGPERGTTGKIPEKPKRFPLEPDPKKKATQE